MESWNGSQENLCTWTDSTRRTTRQDKRLKTVSECNSSGMTRTAQMLNKVQAPRAPCNSADANESVSEQYNPG